MSCQTSIGHEDCGFNFPVIEHEGHQSAPNSWERSKNKVYRRKVARQQGKIDSGPVMHFKKGKR